MRADRLLGILLALDRKKKVTAQQLAEKFEVSVRTIYRDIDVLSLDYPIQAENGPDGGYSLLESFKLPKLPFKKEEVAALTLMGSVTGKKLGLIEGKVFQEAYSKLLSSLHGEGESRTLSERILIDIEPWSSPPKRPEVLEALKAAILEDSVLEFDYTKEKGKGLACQIEPYGCTYRSGYWYLVGYDRAKKGYRVYRTDRVSGLRVLAEKFTRDSEFNLEKFWNEEMPRQYRERGEEVRIAFDPSVGDEIKKKVWGSGETRQLEDGRVELTFRTFDIPRLISFVLSFGPRAELLEPIRLRETISAALGASMGKYR